MMNHSLKNKILVLLLLLNLNNRTEFSHLTDNVVINMRMYIYSTVKLYHLQVNVTR